MSKGSATEQTLGNLHSKITAVFQRILERYEARLQAIEDIDPDDIRSEEHTSELQSLTNLVCRLLLEKKKNLFFFIKNKIQQLPIP